MREAIGGVVNITIIVLFLVIVSGYLAFNINYTKAFKVKNKIISTIEQYEGNCNIDNGACDQAIKQYMVDIGYSVPEFNLYGNNNKYDICRSGYCIKKITADNNKDSSIVFEGNDKFYYEVMTVISIDIPIINKIMPQLEIFQVTGSTKLIDA